MDWPSIILGFILGMSAGFGVFYLYMKRITKKMMQDIENFDRILENLKSIKK